MRTFTTDGRTRATASESEPARFGAGAAAVVSVELGSVTVTVCAAVEVDAPSLSSPLQPASSHRHEHGRENPHGSLGKVTTAMPAAASSRTSPPARNANVTSCLRCTLLTSDPILSYASRRSPTLSAS